MKVPTQDSRTADLPQWVQGRDGVTVLLLRVQPGARRTAVIGPYGARLKIALHAPPVDGKANDELLRFLCARLALRANQVRVLSGLASRDKTVAVGGADPPEALAGRLLAGTPPGRAAG